MTEPQMDAALLDPALDALAIEAPVDSRARRLLKKAGWIGFAFFCLIFFTLVKFPEDRLRATINSTISGLLAPRGITFQADQSRVGLLLGLSYTMKHVTLTVAGQETPFVIDSISVSPSLLSLIFGTFAGSFDIENAGGELSGTYKIAATEQAMDANISFRANQLDIGKLGVLKALAGISASGILNGKANLSGDLAIPSTIEGSSALTLKKIQIDAQSVMGFSIPTLKIPEAVVEVTAEKGKLQLKNVKIEKGGDLWANVSGTVGLAKVWDTSTLDLKTQFGVSENVLKSFVLLDALLGAGKQADGSYGFTIGGSLAAPFPNPMGLN